ncbi:MAG: polysaccharide deacetylase family protein [Meiothermus sp.]|nr:polysaccharide deacetylase family protein [Meiothermus sp.]
MLTGWVAMAQATAPLPPVQAIPPGESQPLAPGQRPAAVLPEITLSPPLEGVRKIEYASNGFIEAAHALLVIPGASTTPAFMLLKAQRVVAATFQARPGLQTVDISIYGGDYRGFGGPLPRFTASVSRSRFREFERLTLASFLNFDHLWINPDDVFYGPPAPPTDEPEKSPLFEGTRAQLKAQQLEQAAASSQGGVVGSRLYHGNPGRPVVALTFDDAPHPLYAPLLLDSLRRAGVHATFFCIGRNAEAYPYFVREMVQEGHEVANHTYHHVRLNTLDEATVTAEITRANQVLQNITGKPVVYFRPPGGRFSPAVLQAVERLGMTLAFWTDDPGDFDNIGQAPLEASLLSRLRSGGIVLLHDNVLQTIVVLPRFLSLAQRTGYRLGTVSDLVRGPAGR